ncbi:MAG: acetyl-CoA C-acyltransferase [Chloroflexi bacterium]|nr:acetyl-CoA C-acyltransferase [Chloroflexota bacterium]
MAWASETVVIVGSARTPIGKLGGRLAPVPAPQLGAVAIRAALARSGVAPEQVDYVVMGNVLQAGVGQAPARQAAIGAGIPAERSTALTVNMVCASGLIAVVQAAQAIQGGMAAIAVAGGMESMDRAPHLLPALRTGVRLGHVQMVDALVHDGLWCPFANWHMGDAAEAIARQNGITRAEQDAYALESQRRAVAAMRAGRFDAEIAPVEMEAGRERVLVAADEGPRPDTSAEALARLRPAFQEGGTVTAGNASLISDGAAALVLMAESTAARLGIPPLARIMGASAVGVEPVRLFEAPVAAIRRLLERTESALGEYDLVEVNEAYAAQVLANGRDLGWDWAKVNPWGGAIALGHPIGASGARLLVTLLHALRANGGRRGIAALCHGGGGAVALAVERVA